MPEIVQEIFTDRIRDPKDAMRSELDRNALFELADNIKQNGLINPITVRPIRKSVDDASGSDAPRVGDDASVGDQFYEVVAGHRRLSACKIAGLIKISCIVRDLDDNKTFEVMAAENLERADVDPVDEAIFINRFITQTGKSVNEVAKALRRSVQYVETRIAVGNMPDYMQQYLKSGDLKLGAALALVQIENDNIRRVWVDMAVRDGVSVAQAQYWLHGWKLQQLPGGERSDAPPSDFAAGEAQPVLFECAIDGQKYDARLFKTYMVYEGNLDLFNAVVKELRTAPGRI